MTTTLMRALRTLRSLSATMLLGMLLLAAVSTGAQAQTLKVIVRDPGAVGSSGRTGLSNFDATAGAGFDTSATDHVIRTLDTVQYDWNYSVNGSDAAAVTFSSTLPTDASCGPSSICAQWLAPLPPQCGAGSSISGDLQTMVCVVGTVPAGSSTSVLPVMRVLSSAPNGLQLTPSVTMTGTSTGGVAATPSSTTGYSNNDTTPSTLSDTVSAAPKYDLSKVAGGSRYTFNGPGGVPGWYVFQFAAIRAKAGADGMFGISQLSGPIVFHDTLTSPAGVLGTLDGCGVSNSTHGNYGAQFGPLVAWTLPGSQGSSYNEVTNSGTWSCTQSVAGGPITVTITGADTSGTRYPNAALDNSAVQRGYVAVGYITVFYPTSQVSAQPTQTAIAADAFDSLSATSTSGQPNVDPDAANQTQSITLDATVVNTTTDGIFRKYYSATPTVLSTLPFEPNAADGLSPVVPGQTIYSHLYMQNPGYVAYVGAMICDKIDNTKVTVTDITAGNAVAYVTTVGQPARTATVQYSNSAHTPDAQHATCGIGGDDVTDGPWFNSTAAVPGGNAAITKIRIIDDTDPLGGSISAGVQLTVRAGVANNTTIPNWVSGRTPTGPNPGWFHGGGTIGATFTDPFNCADGHCDRVTVIYEIARIIKDTVPNGQTTAGAGQPVNFVLVPILQSLFASPQPSHVVVVDTMPAGLGYVAGSASRTPTSVVVNPDGTTTITWDLGMVTPNGTIPQITLQGLVSPLIANGIALTNEATITSDLDPAPLGQRRSVHTLTISNPGGLSVAKSALTPTVHVNTPISYALSYANTGATAIVSSDLIDILPSPLATPASSFSGTLTLAGVSGSNGETFSYTTAAPNTINPDPGCQSNGGTTVGSGCAINPVPNATTWTACPGNVCPASATAIRAHGGAFPAGAAVRSLTLTLNASGNAVGNVYQNAFTGRADVSALPVTALAPQTTVTTAPLIDIVKSAAAPVAVSGQPNTYDVPYTLIVKNTGTIDDPNVQVVDSLATAYGGAGNVVGVSALAASASGTSVCAPNAPFNGTTVTNLLAGTGTLRVGDSCTITFTARVVNAAALNNAAGSTCTPQVANQYCNSAVATSYATPPGTPGGTGTDPQATDTSNNSTVAPPTHDTTTVPTPTLLGGVADMTPALSGLPSATAPGAAQTGTLTCTNAGPATATGALCSASVRDNAGNAIPVVMGTCTPSAGSTLSTVLVGGTLSCPFSYTAPGTAGGSDTAATSLVITGVTGATNDNNGGTTTGGNNSTSTPLTIIDALDDPAATLAQAASGTTSYPLINNDTVGIAAAAIGTNIAVPTLVSNGGLTGASIDGAGNLVVPNTAPTGSYTITYRICVQPAATPAACDTATKTITITGNVPDVTVTYTGLPTAASPNQTVTGTLVCTNLSASTLDALATTCVPGPGVTLTGACVASSGSAASLPPGATLSCPISAVAPPNGRLTLTGTTSATNEVNLANNNTVAQIPVIDAVDDGTTTLPTSGGRVPLYPNDTFNGAALVPSTITPSIVNGGGLPPTTVIDPVTGQLVVPPGTPVGTYPVTYRICTQAPLTIACDTATVTVVIQGFPDLTVRKTHTPSIFTELNPGSYRIVAGNAGTLPTVGSYQIVDTLPAGFTVAAVPIDTGWDCSASVVGSNRISCTSSVVIAAQSDSAYPITLAVNVAAGICTTPDASGVCAGSNFINNVVVGGGGEPPTATGNDSYADPTPVQASAGVSGQVWLDLDHERTFSSGDVVKSGFVVEVLRGGAVLATATTDSNGNYRVNGLIPGSGYSVRFKDPASGAYHGRPVSRDPAGGNDPSAAPGNGVVAGGAIQNLTLGYVAATGSTVRINQSLPLDPEGVVYDSATRRPVAGATVTLLNADGSTVAPVCVVGGATSVQTAVGMPGGLDGAYSFLLAAPAPTGCAGAADYTLRVTPPTGYTPSGTIPAQVGTLRAPAGCLGTIPGLCVVQQQAGAPALNQPTPYYLSLHLDPVLGPDVVNNHIPLDPAVAPGLVIAKTGDRASVEVGDSLRYAITIRRSDRGAATLPMVELVDTLPVGFRYIAGTASVATSANPAGATKIADPAGAPGSVLRFAVGALPAGGQLTLYYRVRVGVGSQQGDGINRARASIGSGIDCGAQPALCSNESRYAVRVEGGVFTTDACVVGRVFVDCNHNHVPDPEELGIPGVRLVMQDGTTLTTDVEGKYSRCSVTPQTHVIVVDATTLPRGSRLTTSSHRNAGDAMSLFVDLKNGSLQRADFVEGSCSATVIEQVKARRALGEVNAAQTEKKGGAALKFVGKPVTAPQQATDGADQRAVKPRSDGGAPPGPRGTTESELNVPVSALPQASGATQPAASGPTPR